MLVTHIVRLDQRVNQDLRFQWISYQNSLDFLFLLSSLPDHNFANTLSILIFRPALKSYDPNSLISGIYYCKIPRHRGEKRHFVERNFAKMGMQHPITGTDSEAHAGFFEFPHEYLI